MSSLSQIINKTEFSKSDIVAMLSAKKDDRELLLQKAKEIKESEVGEKVYYRGLVEFSNICEKDCYYCGIRKGNNNVKRFNLSDNDILLAAKFAHKNNYGSFVLQSGELVSQKFTNRIENLLKQIKQITNGELGITISLGEQSEETYRRWFRAGAHRYLLRIESSNKELYYKIHPNNELHNYEKRLDSLYSLQKIGYQTGTGVMIGLPFQTLDDLADDILFMKSFNVDMVGMGPYIEHPQTPLFEHTKGLISQKERFNLALQMIAVLRIVMRDINIAAATALQAIDPLGREKAIEVGANIIMPNITPGDSRNNYKLYNNKPLVSNQLDEEIKCSNIGLPDSIIGYGEWGDSKHYAKRIKKR